LEAHLNLGVMLARLGKPEEAIAEFREAVRLEPDRAAIRFTLGTLLFEHGQIEEAVAAYREAIRLDPSLSMAHTNLGLALAQRGKPQDAIAEYREAIRLQPGDAEAHCNLGRSLQQRGEFPEALAELRRGHEIGSKRPGWRYPTAEWVRDCERMAALDARLQAIVAGRAAPADASERLDLLPVAYVKGLYATAARLWGEAFAIEPKRATDLLKAYRYDAACSAALAGCGVGKDRPPPTESVRAALRQQALEWLNADLAAWSTILAGGSPESRSRARRILQHWGTDGDLAGVRDPSGLARLPEAERIQWRALWTAVDELLAKARDVPPRPPPGSSGRKKPDAPS
jgi:tetratricopeptide (TPR) repeat protein